MRYIIFLFTFCFVLVSQSCKDGDASQSTPATAPFSNTSPNLNNNNATSGVNSGVEHYICPNGHVGKGGPSAGQCSECGAELSHNDAYHNTPPPTDLVNQSNNTLNNPQTAQPATNPGVEHYICPNGHVGSGGPSAGQCSQCGAELSHNDAFHNSPVGASGLNANTVTPSTEQITPQPSAAVSPVFQNVGSTGAPTVGGGGGAPGLEPAQNTRGVWHYICPDGHAGGGGSATACSQCGKTLIHNDVYHQ